MVLPTELSVSMETGICTTEDTQQVGPSNREVMETHKGESGLWLGGGGRIPFLVAFPRGRNREWKGKRKGRGEEKTSSFRC